MQPLCMSDPQNILAWTRMSLMEFRLTTFPTSNDSDTFCRLEEGQQYFKDASRMGRLGEPVEMAKIMAFMVSDDNAYMSGSEIISDGGLGAGS